MGEGTGGGWPESTYPRRARVRMLVVAEGAELEATYRARRVGEGRPYVTRRASSRACVARAESLCDDVGWRILTLVPPSYYCKYIMALSHCCNVMTEPPVTLLQELTCEIRHKLSLRDL